jgi:uncharacterized protein (DUF1810 family)
MMDDVTDRYDLQRFLTAQEHTYESAVAELRRGHKTSHWMWFVFPQIHGLGRSPMAQRFAVCGLEEARAYLEHPVLGSRLRDCAGILLELADAKPGRRADAVAIFGEIDAVKLRSSMTLFAAARAAEPAEPAEPAPAADAEARADDNPFRQVLEAYFGGEPDQATLDRLRSG